MAMCCRGTGARGFVRATTNSGGLRLGGRGMRDIIPDSKSGSSALEKKC